MTTGTRALLVTDLDNTLWDWVGIWYAMYSKLIEELTQVCGVPRDQLLDEIRRVHQTYGTTEYSNLVNEVPSLIAAAAPELPAERYRELLHGFRSRRKAETALYPGVRTTLYGLRAAGVRVVGYTESQSYWSAWRIRETKLDGVIDTLYSAPDHSLPAGKATASESLLNLTAHHHTPAGVLKPSPEILQTILEDQNVPAERAVYIGDTIMKDVAMAQHVGVFDVHAQYGESHRRDEYDLLKRVSHWTAADVEREKEIAESRESIAEPSLVCDSGFAQIRRAFDQ